MWGPRTWVAYPRNVLAGRRYEKHTGDSLQLGADVVIGDDLRVVEVFRPREPDDRPTVDQLLHAVDRVRTT